MIDIGVVLYWTLSYIEMSVTFVMNYRIGLQLLVCLVAFFYFDKNDLRKLLPNIFAVYGITCAVLVVMTAFYPYHLTKLSDIRWYVFLAGLVTFVIARDTLRGSD